MPFIRKYSPKNVKEVRGQDKAVKQLKDYISDYKKMKKKGVLVYGPPGCGKTCSVHAIAEELDLELIEVNASDFRNKDKINMVVGNSSKQMSLFMKQKLILVDELDGISGMKDRGGIAEVNRLLKDTSFPIVMTCNNPYDQKFSTLRKNVEMLAFHTLSSSTINSVLKDIANKEGIEFEEEALKELARRTEGDLRGAINDLEILSNGKKLTMKEVESLGHRDREEKMFNALTKVLKIPELEHTLGAFDMVDEDIDKQILWVDENMPKEYQKPMDLARAYNCLSRADVFRGRIRKWQHWRFLVYINALITGGIAVSKDEKYDTFNKYGPPQRILSIWRANMKFSKRKAIAEKIGKKLHTSKKRVVIDIIPFLSVMCKDKKLADAMQQDLELNDDEMAFLTK